MALVLALFGLALSAVPPGLPTATAEVPAVALSDCYSSDHGYPTVTSLSISPKVVDVRDRGAQVIIRATASDTGGPGVPTGVGSISVRLQSPKLDRRDLDIVGVNLQLDEAGDFKGTVTIKRWWTPGRWTVTPVAVSDAAKPLPNQRDYTQRPLLDLGPVQHLTVLSTPDLAPPSLTNLTMSPTSLNTRRSAKTVRVRATFRDADSGVGDAAVVAFKEGEDKYVWTKLRLRSGGARRGVWSGDLRMKKWVADSSWTIQVDVRDRSGQDRYWAAVRLRQRGFPQTLRIVSDTDDLRPVASEFVTSPSSVDLRTNDQQVTVRLRATDAQSGVGEVDVLMINPSRSFNFTTKLRTVSGSARDGVWEATLPFQRCRSEAGTWVAWVTVTDRAGRDRTYRELPSMNLVMDADDHVRPFLIRYRVQPPLAGPWVVTFNEDVQGITPESMLVRRLTFPPSAPWPGGWTCLDTAQAVTSCTTGAVRTARFVPTEPFRPLDYEVEINPVHTLGVTDLSGNPPREQIYAFIPE